MARPKRASQHKLEIEIKVPCENSDRLKELPGTLILDTPRHFEDNWMLDTNDSRLHQEQSALRVRYAQGRGVVTFKGLSLSSAESKFKVREELESQTEDPNQMLAIFERLGYHTFFRYQKYRTIYHITLLDGQHLKAMFDETPIGNFLELEGSEEAVNQAVSALNLTPKDYVTTTYIGMQATRCQQAGKPLEDLVFEDTKGD